MRKLHFKYISLILIILFLASPTYALPQPSYDFYVYDAANILNKATEEYIIQTNLELYEKTEAQIVVATINDLEGMDINRYATELFDQWDIGGSRLDNGLLILIVPAEGQLWIEVGYGLEGVLPDSIVKRIIENRIIPYFSQGDYDSGVLAGYDEILNYVEKEYDIELKSRTGQYDGEYESDFTLGYRSRLSNIFLILGIIIFLIVDFKFFGGWLTYSMMRTFGRGSTGYRGNSGSSNRGRSRGGGGRSGGGGAGGRW